MLDSRKIFCWCDYITRGFSSLESRWFLRKLLNDQENICIAFECWRQNLFLWWLSGSWMGFVHLDWLGNLQLSQSFHHHPFVESKDSNISWLARKNVRVFKQLAAATIHDCTAKLPLPLPWRHHCANAATRLPQVIEEALSAASVFWVPSASAFEGGSLDRLITGSVDSVHITELIEKASIRVRNTPRIVCLLPYSSFLQNTAFQERSLDHPDTRFIDSVDVSDSSKKVFATIRATSHFRTIRRRRNVFFSPSSLRFPQNVVADWNWLLAMPWIDQLNLLTTELHCEAKWTEDWNPIFQHEIRLGFLWLGWRRDRVNKVLESFHDWVSWTRIFNTGLARIRTESLNANQLIISKFLNIDTNTSE